MGREGLGGKMLSQVASCPVDPNRHPRSPSFNKGQRHRHIPSPDTQSRARRSHQPPTKKSQPEECGSTTEKRADQPALRYQNMPPKGGHKTNMPNHPRTTGQSQQSAQSLMPEPP
ncbi:hypothetical protein XENORESO_001546, partial [Xenotaenia resolanae]